jgi:hypothetical protein
LFLGLHVSHTTRGRLVVVIATLMVAHTARAQTVTWATDASVGFTRGGGGEFAHRRNQLAEITGSVRREVRPGFGVDAEVGYDWSGQIEARGTFCGLDSRGNCVPDFPTFAGPLGLLGITLGAPSATQLRLNAGMARCTLGHTRLGAPVAAMDVAVAPFSRLAIVTGGRAFLVPNYGGDRLSLMTWRLGLRLQSLP